MTVILQTRSKHIFSIANLVREAGGPVERLLRQAGLPSDCLENPESLIPSHGAFSFREIAARSTGLPNIALDATRNLSLASLGSFGKALMAAPTLAAALTQFQSLTHTQTTTATIELQPQRNGGLWVGHRLHFRRHVGIWHSDLYILQWLIKVARLADPNWSPAHIAVSSPATPERKRAIASVGRARSNFESGRTGFVIPQAMLSLPVSNLASERCSLETSLQQLEATAPADNLSDALKQVLIAYRRDRWLTVEQAAEVANTSVRTLQRRLAEEQMSFSTVLKQARLEVAAAMLESTDAKIADIAWGNGYSEHANFTRAFARWSGVSPIEFRRQRRTN